MSDSEPDITLCGLRIWIYGRQYPGSNDFWDGNWLLVKAECNFEGSVVEVKGPIIHLSEIDSWYKECQKLVCNLEGIASLDTMEPNLRVDLIMVADDQLQMNVFIAPDHSLEIPPIIWKIEQSCLPELIKSLD